MDTHKNAPLMPKGREAMVRIVVEGSLTKAAVARQFNTTAKTVVLGGPRKIRSLARDACAQLP